jgi:hypothetical protein
MCVRSQQEELTKLHASKEKSVAELKALFEEKRAALETDYQKTRWPAFNKTQLTQASEFLATFPNRADVTARQTQLSKEREAFSESSVKDFQAALDALQLDFRTRMAAAHADEFKAMSDKYVDDLKNTEGRHARITRSSLAT